MEWIPKSEWRMESPECPWPNIKVKVHRRVQARERYLNNDASGIMENTPPLKVEVKPLLFVQAIVDRSFATGNMDTFAKFQENG